MWLKVEIISKSAQYYFELIVETGERCRNHAGFHAELLMFACELGIRFFLFLAQEMIASQRAPTTPVHHRR